MGCTHVSECLHGVHTRVCVYGLALRAPGAGADSPHQRAVIIACLLGAPPGSSTLLQPRWVPAGGMSPGPVGWALPPMAEAIEIQSWQIGQDLSLSSPPGWKSAAWADLVVQTSTACLITLGWAVAMFHLK